MHKKIWLLLDFLDRWIRKISVSVLLCQICFIYWITRILIYEDLSHITELLSITIKFIDTTQAFTSHAILFMSYFFKRSLSQ